MRTPNKGASLPLREQVASWPAVVARCSGDRCGESGGSIGDRARRARRPSVSALGGSEVNTLRGALARALLCCVLGGSPALAMGQIVDTLSAFETTHEGLSGRFGTDVRATGGNSRILDVGANAALQYSTDTSRLRWLASHLQSRSNGERSAEESFAHLRHNHRIGLRSWTIAFVQAQRNPFQRLRSRVLVGAGLRRDLRESPSSRWTVGMSPMVEIETTDVHSRHAVGRLSVFLDGKWKSPRGVRVSSTVYFQPRLSTWGDRRASASTEVETPLAQHLSLVLRGAITHDARPPEDVRSVDWTLRTGLSWRFGS